MNEPVHCCEPDNGSVPFPKHQHAFFIVGTEHLFLVHMTNMWIDCHLYQFILEIGVPEDVKQRYLDDRKRHPTDWYIIGNEHDDTMSLPNIQRGQRTSFRGSIWRGWPTKKGSPHWPWSNDDPVIKGFEVQVKRIVCFRHFDFNFNNPNTLSYILFGKGNEAHMQHYQVKQPEFDHVVTLAEAPEWLAAEGRRHRSAPLVGRKPRRGWKPACTSTSPTSPRFRGAWTAGTASTARTPWRTARTMSSSRGSGRAARSRSTGRCSSGRSP